MSSQWKLLITLIHSAFGEFLRQVDLEGGAPQPAKSVQQSQPAPPVPPSQPAQPAPAEGVKESEDEEVPPAVPLIEDLRDPAYPRGLIEKFLATRGFAPEAISKMTRPALNKTAIEQVEAINTAGTGVTRRKGKGEAKADTKKPTAESALAALSADERAAIAKMLNVDPAAADVVPQLAKLLSTPEAVTEMLGVATQTHDAEPEVPVASVQIAPEAAPPLASTPPKASRRPAAQTEPAEPVAEAAAPAADGPGARLLAHITATYGSNGVMTNAPTHEDVTGNIAILENTIQKGLKSDKPAVVARYTKYTETLGCVGTCIGCRRGGAQMAACLTVFDKDYAKQVDPNSTSNHVDKVNAGELLVRFKEVEGDVWDDEYVDGPAELEVVR